MIGFRPKVGIGSGFILSIVFAFLYVIVCTFDLFVPSFKIKMGEPAPITIRIPHTGYFRTTLVQTEYLWKHTLIKKGTKVEDPERWKLIKAYESTRDKQRPLLIVGLYIIYLFASLLFTIYMQRFGTGIVRLLRCQIVIFFCIFLFVLGAKLFFIFTSLPEYYLPLLGIPFIIAFYINQRVAFCASIFLSFLVSSLLNFNFQVLVIFLIQSAVGIACIRPRRHIFRFLLLGGILAGLSGIVLYIATSFIFGSRIGMIDLSAPQYSGIVAAGAGGIFSSILGLFILPPLERVIGVTSWRHLIDLVDLNQPLLKTLKVKAPGTYQHSLSIANLGEVAANTIGANAMLIRAGAYYHDIGKTIQPEYFVENQRQGENPHDKLTPEVSADVIFAHITEGVKIAKKHSLPPQLIDFIVEHHGSSLLEYFYHKCITEGNPKDLSEKDFGYPGVKPQTRETGILMIVDAVEAASHTIKEPTPTDIENLVMRIIFDKLTQGQLDESGLSIQDLQKISVSLIDSLINLYHARIEYPWQETKNQGDK
jgi:hypothetical protein